MKFTIVGQGTAVPPRSIDCRESVDIVQRMFCRTDQERRGVSALYRMAGIGKRHSVLLREPGHLNNGASYELMHAPKGPQDKGPPLGARMAVYEQQSAPLAIEAADSAIANAGLEPGDISHLVTVSCSGFFAPGVDIKLVEALGLPNTVERAHIGFMGCQGALNGLRVARGFAGGDPAANVLLCAVELCSIHYHYGWDPQRVVANALFADGAAALVGGLRDGAAGWRVEATGACLIPDSQDDMTWRIRDNGFEMSLSARVPGLIKENLSDWLKDWLGTHNLTVADVATWAVHPGGPRILGSVACALSLPVEVLEVSCQVLQEYGNMSSPTILFIVDRLRALDAPLPCVALAFGPGLMVEAVLFG